MYRLLVILALAALPSLASNTQPGSIKEVITGVTTYAPIIKKTAPAVVSISALQVVNTDTPNPLTQDPFFGQFLGKMGGLPKKLEKSLGSGVIVDADGYIVTCLHVVRNARTIVIQLNDRRRLRADVVARDPNNDLAVLKIINGQPNEKFPTIPLGHAEKLEVGDVLLAIGNPFGIGQTVTNGIVSGLARNINGHLLIQCDASINPGNSGGALVDMKGELVAIPNAILSKTGASHGIGFAIPIALIKNVLQAAKAGGKLIYPWSGIDVQEMEDTELAKEMNPVKYANDPSKNNGILVIVTNVHLGSPAIAAGLKQGDIIIDINSQTINSDDDYLSAMQNITFGESITLKVVRNGKMETIKYTPIEPPALPQPQKTKFEGRNPLSGMIIANLSPALDIEIGLPDSQSGVVILEGGGGVLSKNIGIQTGDILRSINEAPIRSVEEVKEILSHLKPPLTIEIGRGRQIIKVTMK